MLKTRVLTALLLFIAFVSSLLLIPQMGWAVLMSLVAGIAGWEWSGLMRLPARYRIASGIALVLFCLLWLIISPETLGASERNIFAAKNALAVYIPATVFWLLLGPLWLHHKWRLPGNALGLAVGMMVIFPAWMAIVQLRMLGPWVFLAIVATIWVADIGAYFFGRLFGRRKLAPTISPGKTWEGAIGGAAAVILYGLALRYIAGIEEPAVWVWIAGLAVISVVSVVGDLFESLLKRQVGLKDSSNALPGHGGVLDRIDSLTSTLPLVALLWVLSGVLPQ
ncbi:MAG: phosphatidate cytidylyltransferase [Betaproteobacteria bacterium]